MNKKIYKVAVYARFANWGGQNDDAPDAVDKQVQICKEYITAQQDMELTEVFTDKRRQKGSGPAFLHLTEAVMQSKVDCVLFYTPAQFGKNYSECRHFLEKVFLPMNVRCIALVDHFDTEMLQGTLEERQVSLKSYLDTYIAKQIANTVKRQYYDQYASGSPCIASIPYGYKRSGGYNSPIVPDERYAPIVRQIFKDVATGRNISDIVAELNEMGISTPGMAKYESNLSKIKPANTWDNSTVVTIIENPNYTGSLVYGRTKIIDGVQVKVPETEWKIAENTHEPLADRETYEAALAMIKSRKMGKRQRPQGRPENIFHNLIFCGDCGASLHYEYMTKTPKPYGHYTCGAHTRYGAKSCTRHHIYADALTEEVLTEVQQHFVFAAGCKAKLEQYLAEKKDKIIFAVQQKKICGIVNRLIGISKQYQIEPEDRLTELFELTDMELQEAIEEKKRIGKVLMENRWLALFGNIPIPKELTKETAREWVERIDLFENLSVKVWFREGEQMEKLLTYLEMIEDSEGTNHGTEE